MIFHWNLQLQYSKVTPASSGRCFDQGDGELALLKVVAARDQVPEMGDAVRLKNAILVELLLADEAVFRSEEMVAVDEAGPAKGAGAEASLEGDSHNVRHLSNAAHRITIHHLKVSLTANPALGLVANQTLELREELLVVCRTAGESFQLKQLVLELRAVFPPLTIPTNLAVSLKPLSCHQVKKQEQEKGEHHRGGQGDRADQDEHHSGALDDQDEQDDQGEQCSLSITKERRRPTSIKPPFSIYVVATIKHQSLGMPSQQRFPAASEEPV